MKLIALLFSSFGAAFFTFLLQILLSRGLTSEEYGAIAYANALTVIVGTFCATGVSGLYLRHSIIAPDESSGIAFLASKSLRAISSIGYITCLALLYFSKAPLSHSILLSTAVLQISYQALATAHAQAAKRTESVSKIQMLPPLSRALLSSIAILFWASIDTAILALALANAISFIYFQKTILKTPQKRPINNSALGWSKGTLKYSINGTFNVAQLQATTAALGLVLDAKSASYAAICSALLTAVYIAPNTIFSLYLLPKYHQNQGSQNASVHINALLSLLAGALICFLLRGYGNHLIDLLFGSEYSTATKLLSILAFCIPFRFYSTAIGCALLDEQSIKLKILASGAGLVVQVAFFIALYRYGIRGFAYSAVASEALIAALYLSIFLFKNRK